MQPICKIFLNVLEWRMDTETLERHFGGRDEAIRAIGIYRQLWEHWAKKGIPKGRQYEIQVLTKGKVRADCHKLR